MMRFSHTPRRTHNYRTLTPPRALPPPGDVIQTILNAEAAAAHVPNDKIPPCLLSSAQNRKTSRYPATTQLIPLLRAKIKTKNNETWKGVVNSKHHADRQYATSCPHLQFDAQKQKVSTPSDVSYCYIFRKQTRP